MRNRSTLRALIALLIAVAMLAAACGGSDDESADTTEDIVEEQLTDEEPAADDVAGDDTSTDEPADEEPAADDAATDDTSTDEPADEEPADDTPTSGGGDAAVFCARYAENQALFDEVDLFDPEQVESWITTSRNLLAEAIADAPGELVADLVTIEESLGELAGVLEAADYDFFAVSEEEIDATESAEADAAGDRLDAWVDANCPEIDTDDDASLTDDLTTPEGLEAILGSEAGRDAFIEGFVQSTGLSEDQAVCVIDNLDVDLMSQLANDPEAIGGESALDLLEVFETCGIDFTQLAG